MSRAGIAALRLVRFVMKIGRVFKKGGWMPRQKKLPALRGVTPRRYPRAGIEIAHACQLERG